MNRRNLFKMAIGSTGSLIATKALGATNPLTPTKAQTEGPFYPEDWTEYEVDADMTQLASGEALAKGQLTVLTGRVLDFKTSKPIAGAQVDVWQANAFGQYFHDSDATEEDLKDKNFQYRCRIKTDKEGRFAFKTIKPSPYPAGNGWVRPPHIHYKIVTDSHKELITQMYFEGDPLNSLDLILQNMTAPQQDGVIVNFKENQSKVLEGDFTISLVKK